MYTCVVQNQFSSQYWPSWIHKCCQWIWRAIYGVFSFLRLSKLCLKVGISLASPTWTTSWCEICLQYNIFFYVVFDKSWTLTSLNQQWSTFLAFWSTLDKELSWVTQLKIILTFLFSHFYSHNFWGDIPTMVFKLASEGLQLESCRCQYYSLYAMFFLCLHDFCYIPSPTPVISLCLLKTLLYFKCFSHDLVAARLLSCL